MSTKIDDGGPAFPRTSFITSEGDHVGFDGMTLRDWFAGQALSGLMADPLTRPSTIEAVEHIAMRLYQVADAMLAERNKLRQGSPG